jgi:paraquat-inducible protein B
MNPIDDSTTPAAEAPEAVVQEKSGFSLVWLIPIVAALIGAWLVYKHITETGPTITISFETGAGLTAGKTKIKFKDVEVGTVQSIDLKEDLSGVLVTAELGKDSKPYLTEKTRFWVVRARVAAGEVTGLGTLLGGAHIAMDPVAEGEPAREFVGLEQAPVVTFDEPGRRFRLVSETLGSLNVGAPIYYRQIRVGQVADYRLTEAGTIEADIFIHAPHDERVRRASRFWDASGIDVTVDATGIQVNTVSLASILAGGIAFNTPSSESASPRADEHDEFVLYPSERATRERKYAIKRNYRVIFDQSLRGLSVGAPVEFRGLRLGQVVDIDVTVDPTSYAISMPVLLEIEPERLTPLAAEESDAIQGLRALVARGLRAQLASGNLITGQKFVALDFFPQAEPAELDMSGEYPIVPSIRSPLAEISNDVASIVNKLNTVPWDQIGADVGRTADGIADLVGSEELRNMLRELAELARDLQQNVSPALAAALQDAQRTLESARNVIDADSATRTEMNRLLIEAADAARAVRMIAEYLEQHPEALLRGKGE